MSTKITESDDMINRICGAIFTAKHVHDIDARLYLLREADEMVQSLILVLLGGNWDKELESKS